MFVCLEFIVPLENVSLIWRRHHDERQLCIGVGFQSPDETSLLHYSASHGTNVIWLKYCRYGFTHQIINQSIIIISLGGGGGKMSQYCLLPSPLFEICARMFLFDALNHFLPFLCIRHTNSAVVIQDAALFVTFFILCFAIYRRAVYWLADWFVSYAISALFTSNCFLVFSESKQYCKCEINNSNCPYQISQPIVNGSKLYTMVPPYVTCSKNIDSPLICDQNPDILIIW